MIANEGGRKGAALCGLTSSNETVIWDVGPDQSFRFPR
jgi:hypothetical protein